jgi:hypothetical protein
MTSSLSCKLSTLHHAWVANIERLHCLGGAACRQPSGGLRLKIATLFVCCLACPMAMKLFGTQQLLSHRCMPGSGLPV